MPYAFRDGPLSAQEFEVLRLVLSTYRDGSGQNVVKRTGESMPGFRDFERGLASVLGGITPENKGIFDVVVPAEPKGFGISCKMTRFPPAKHLSSFMELANSAALFRSHLLSHQINWVTEPMLAGPAIVDLVSSWHTTAAADLDLASSKYCVLAHDTAWETFQLLCFPLDLKVANPKGDIEWSANASAVNGHIDDDGRRHLLWQYYPNSGGQLKYFPLLRWADWVTPVFGLEKPPLASPVATAARYFADAFPKGWTPRAEA